MKAQKLYVITSGSGLTKIGISHDPSIRRRQIARELADKTLRIAYRTAVPGLDAVAIEQCAHDLLRDHCVRGEWFDVAAEQAIQIIDAAIDIARDRGWVEKRPPSDFVDWNTRMVLKRSTYDAIKTMALSENRSLATMIGVLLSEAVTARSSA